MMAIGPSIFVLFLLIPSLTIHMAFSVPESKFDCALLLSKEKTNGTPKGKIMIKRLQSAGEYWKFDGLLRAEQWKKRTKIEPWKKTQMAWHGQRRQKAEAAQIGDKHSEITANGDHVKGPTQHLLTKTLSDNGIWKKPTFIRIRKLEDNASPVAAATVASQMRFTNQPERTPLTGGQRGNGQTARKMAWANGPPTTDPLQMTRENCKKMERYATLFGVSDPIEWAKGNCPLLQMFVRASCEHIATFVSSCTIYATTENTKKIEGKVEKMASK